MHPALRAMLTETVLQRAYLSQDAYGKPTYGDPVPRSARVEGMVRVMTDAQGHERVSRARIFLDATPAIDVQDLLMLPDGTTGPLLNVTVVREPHGAINHYEVSL
jgi:hypothetical protein